MVNRLSSFAKSLADQDQGHSNGRYTRRKLLGNTLRGGSALALGGGILLAGCGSDSSSGETNGAGGSGEKKGTIAFLIPSSQAVRWQGADVPFFKRAAADQGYEVIVKSAENNVATQASQVENMVTVGVDAIVLAAIDTDAATSMVAKATAARIPVIAYQFLIEDADVAAFLGRDDKTVGVDQATASIGAFPRGNYVIVKGDQGYSVARDKAAGALQVLDPLVTRGDIKIVAQQWIKAWSPDLARSFVENTLTVQNNDVQAVIVANDDMAYGVVSALRSQGLAGKAFVTGEDAELEALKLIKAGDMGFTTFARFDEMATTAVTVAGEAIAGTAIRAPRTIDNGYKEVPWFVVRSVGVDRAEVSSIAARFPWWVGRGGKELAAA